MRRSNQEALTEGALKYPNIAHIDEIGKGEGLNFIAMDYVEGVTLCEKIIYGEPN